MEMYRLSEYRDRHPQSLSGGQKQRLTIATAELLERDVYILDEPTSGLDGENMFMIADQIRNLQSSDKIILLISHDYEFLMKTCTEVLPLSKDGVISFDPKTQKEKILACLRGENFS